MSLRSWVQDRSRLLERAYRASRWLLASLDPLFSRLGYGRLDRWLRGPEELGKKLLFDCRMCGHCILHSTGMTCPMTCPKSLRNGPCGGVRENGNCEVIPDMRCVWVEAFERSRAMPKYGAEILLIQPPLDRQLEGSSAWVNTLTGVDRALPPGWEGTSQTPLVRLEEIETWKATSSQKVA
jgi:hypothetical protein